MSKMTREPTRRKYLALAGTTLGVGGAATTTATAQVDECTRAALLEESLNKTRRRIRELRSQLKTSDDRIETLEDRLDTLYKEIGTTDPVYPGSIRKTAHQVGIGVRPSVVALQLTNNLETRQTTGWFVKPNLIVAAASAIEGIDAANGWSITGESFSVDVVDEAVTSNIALLRADQEGRVPTFGSSVDLQTGQPVIQVGHSNGFGFWVIALGEINHLQNGTVTTTIPGLPGNEGAPLLNLDGEVVGVTTGRISRSDADNQSISEPVVRFRPLEANTDSRHVRVDEFIDKIREAQ